ncbi:MAG: stage II sporulation protein M [Alicyclobacillaceae bacterium]|nr:stage II sporulation protein M [Alicyclobacillaceae bacterium]
MDATRFRQLREARWRELEAMQRGRRQSFTSAAQLDRFASLYRLVAGDLSYARTYFPDDPVTAYLNGLVAAAHTRLYRQRTGNAAAVAAYLAGGFARQFRQHAGYIAVAAAILTGGALYGYLLTVWAPLAAYQLLPPAFADAAGRGSIGPHAWNAPLMSSVIMTNNIWVALEAFAGGCLLGTLTTYALWQNGVVLGTLAAWVQTQSHQTALFWSLIVPHGVTELLAVCIAGGAGLLFAHRVVAPGPFPRRAALVHGLRQAAKLVVGVVPMLVIAGIIEGFLTPAPWPTWSKFVFAAITLGLWAAYFSRAGRCPSERESPAPLQVLPDHADDHLAGE